MSWAERQDGVVELADHVVLDGLLTVVVQIEERE